MNNIQTPDFRLKKQMKLLQLKQLHIDKELSELLNGLQALKEGITTEIENRKQKTAENRIKAKNLKQTFEQRKKS